MIECGLCFIWQPSFVRNYPACCSRHSVYVFNRFISRTDNKFKLLRSDQGFLSEGFFQRSLHFHLFLSSHSDLFFHQLIIFSDFGYFFYNKDVFPFYKVFSTSHIARGIIKLIAWTTSFLEERLHLEVTWLIWNANNAPMSPPWPKNVHLYSRRLLFIQNPWSTNLT